METPGRHRLSFWLRPVFRPPATQGLRLSGENDVPHNPLVLTDGPIALETGAFEHPQSSGTQSRCWHPLIPGILGTGLHQSAPD